MKELIDQTDKNLESKIPSAEETKYRNALGRLGYIEIPGAGLSGPISELFVWPRVRDYERTRTSDFEDEDPRGFAQESVSTLDLSSFPSNSLKRCIIVAGPGFGKSVLLEAIRSTLLQTTLVPVVIPVALLAASKLDVLSYLAAHTNREFNVAIDWSALCEAGRAVILFDGLDEVSLASRQSVLESIHRFDARFEHSAWALTVRDPAILTGHADARILEILPLDNSDVVAFANAWKKRLPHIDGWELTRRLDSYPDLKLLVRIPLFLCLLLATWQSGRPLPKNRRELIEGYLVTLFRPERHKTTVPDDIDGTLFRSIAERVAFDRVEAQEIGTSEADVLGIIRDEDQSASADAIFERFIKFGILKRTGLAHLEFPFPIIQEYLAGCYIVSKQPHTLKNRLGDAIQRPWAQVIQFALELHPNPTAIIREIISRRDDAFHTALRLVGRCVVNGARVDSDLKTEIANRLAEVWPYTTWQLRNRIGALVADGFTKPLEPAVRKCLSHTWLLHDGAGDIVADLKVDDITREVVHAHLKKLTEWTWLRELRSAIDPIADEIYAIYAARARQSDVTDKQLDGLSNLVGDISPNHLRPDTYLDLALDEAMPVPLRLESFCVGPKPLDPRAEALMDEGLRSDDWKMRWSATHALRRHAQVQDRTLSILCDESVGLQNRRKLVSSIKELFPDDAARTAFLAACIAEKGMLPELRDIAMVFAARYGDEKAFVALVERLSYLPTDLATNVVSLFGHYRNLDLGRRAAKLLRERVTTPWDAVQFSHAARTGMTSIYEMDWLDGGGLQPCPPHPAISEFEALLTEWAFSAGMNFELDGRLRQLTATSELGSGRALGELGTLIASLCLQNDVPIESGKGLDHTVSGALRELRDKRFVIDPKLLDTLARRSPYNTASAAVDMIAARGTREAFDLLIRLYEHAEDSHLQGVILSKLETLSGRLSLLVYEEEDHLIVNNAVPAPVTV